MKKMKRCLVAMACVCIVAATVQAEVIFVDQISGYDTSLTDEYVSLNSDVVMTQNNGGDIAVANSSPYFNTTLPKQFVTINSGTDKKYTTIAVNSSQSERYGQVLFTVGKGSSDIIMRLSVLGVSNPQLPDTYWALNTQAAADIMLHADGNILYYSNNTHTNSLQPYPKGAETYFNVTFNYDLDNDTYEIWINDTQFLSTMPFAAPQTSIESIAVGGARYYSGSAQEVLSGWQWQVSNDTPFTGGGVYVPEPTTIALLAVGGILAVFRRKR